MAKATPSSLRAFGSSARAASSRSNSGGIVAPHISVMRLIWLKFVTGMIPGMIGTVMPAARASSTKLKYSSLS